jgi:hypothetical protein
MVKDFPTRYRLAWLIRPLVAQCLPIPPAPPWLNVMLLELSIKILDDLPRRGAVYRCGNAKLGLGAVYGVGFAAARLRATN